MSVIYFTDKELSCIYGNLADIVMRADSGMDIGEPQLLPFMIRVGLCNRFAYKFNYHEDESPEIVLKIPNIEKLDYSKLSLKRLIEKLSLLEYNCITNSGKCFVDKEDKKLLENLLYSLKWRYIKMLERKLKE